MIGIATRINRELAAFVVLGLAASAGLVAVGGGPALAASAAAPTCTDTWTGQALQGQWTDPKDWSTGKVPGPASDVCLSSDSFVDVLTDVSVKVNSLHVGGMNNLTFNGTAAHPLTLTVATSITIVPSTNNERSINLTDTTVSTPQINDQGGYITTTGTCALTSPDIVFSRAIGTYGSVLASSGTTTLSSLSQLSNGTLTGVGISATDATVVLPGDITGLASSIVEVGANSAIEDPAGHNALTGLSSVDSGSFLQDASGLTLTASGLTDAGNVSLTGGTTTIGGPVTLAAHSGSLALSGNAALQSSQIMVANGAELSGGPASIAANVVNDGAVILNPGTLTITGNYTQTSGASLTSVFGALLTVGGTAALAGEVVTGEVFPKAGDEATVLSYGSLSGGFTRSVLGIRLTVKPHEVDATIVPQIEPETTTVAPGQTVTVKGRSFAFGERVKFFLDHTGGTPLARGSHAARVEGILPPTVVPIPASVSAGVHKLIAIGSDGSRASTTITVS